MSRYSRQELFAPVGPQGQRRIRASRVLLIGCGALGTHLAEFCTRAGVGELVIVDRDFVDSSNLGRQGLFSEQDARACTPKAEAARAALGAMNSDVSVRAIVDDFTHRNAERLATGATLLLDGTDNFETRYLLNDLSVKQGIPWIYAACVGSRAVCMPVIPGESACLRCLLDEQPAAGGETCDTAGIIMPAVLQAVAWASGAALKWLSGRSDAILRKLLTVDTWSGERSAIDASAPRADCQACGAKEFPWLDGKRGGGGARLCGRDSVQIRAPERFDYAGARERIGRAARVTTENNFLLRADFEGLTVTLYHDGRAIVHGAGDEGRAVSVYNRLVGV